LFSVVQVTIATNHIQSTSDHILKHMCILNKHVQNVNCDLIIVQFKNVVILFKHLV
jgi:hypothetical protein